MRDVYVLGKSPTLLSPFWDESSKDAVGSVMVVWLQKWQCGVDKKGLGKVERVLCCWNMGAAEPAAPHILSCRSMFQSLGFLVLVHVASQTGLVVGPYTFRVCAYEFVADPVVIGAFILFPLLPLPVRVPPQEKKKKGSHRVT